MRELPHEYLHRLFYPSVPVILMSGQDAPLAMAAISSYMAVTDNPPRIAVALRKGSRTLNSILSNKNFSANWLDIAHVRLFDVIGFSGASGIEKLQRSGLKPGKWQEIPYIEGASAIIFAKLMLHLDLGTHIMILADVVRAMVLESFSENWDYKAYKPIFYLGSQGRKGRYATLF